MLNGKTKVTLDGKQYQLVLDVNAMCDLEAALGMPALDVLISIEEGAADMTRMRAVFWALFQAHHPEVSMRDAGALFSQAALKETLAAAMPTPNPQDAEGTVGNAPAAAQASSP